MPEQKLGRSLSDARFGQEGTTFVLAAKFETPIFGKLGLAPANWRTDLR